MRKCLPAILLFSLSACAAPWQWAKPGADDATLARDGKECRQSARAAAFATYSQAPPGPYAVAVGPSSYAGIRTGAANELYYGGLTEEGPYLMEQRLADACMRRRGYDRQPVQQSA